MAVPKKKRPAKKTDNRKVPAGPTPAPEPVKKSREAGQGDSSKRPLGGH